MENKIHDDQLDDYVRKSFEDYEEDPAPDMWARVERDLAPASRLPRVSIWQNRWRVAAAAAIVLLLFGLVGEHFYYQKKISALSVRRGAEQALPAEKNMESIETNATQSRPSAAPGPAPALHEQQFLKVEKSPSSEQRQKVEASRQDSAYFISNKLPPIEKNFADQSSQPQVSQSTSLPNKPEEIVPTAPDPLSGIENNMLDANGAFSKLAVLEPLAGSISLLPSSMPAPPSRIQVDIEPVREPTGWYAGLHITPHFVLDNSPAPLRRPGGRPVFVSRQETPDFSSVAWLKIGKKLDSRWSLESGIGYSALSRTAVHTPHFRFGDGITDSVAGWRRFSYDLGAYSGSAAVSLGMERADSDPISDNEPVWLRIQTSERVQLLRIPLLAACRLGTGRLHAVVKAGVVGNFFLKNELDIAARVSQNNRFRPVQGNGSYTVQLEQSGAFFLGYWLSAGGEFKLSRHIGIIAESSFLGDFARRDAAGQRLPNPLSMGLNVGTNYYF